jgi:hypothetical protein
MNEDALVATDHPQPGRCSTRCARLARSRLSVVATSYRTSSHPLKAFPAFPRPKRLGTVLKCKKTESLPPNVPIVPGVPSNSQERQETLEVEKCDGVGTLGTFSDKANSANGLGAFPVQNLPGNAGNGEVGAEITSEMRRRLYELSYTGPEINKMTPADAHAILDAAPPV